MKMDSMLNVKSDLDPFELYEMKNINDNIEDIQSARIKLAVLKAKNKLSDEEDVISQAEHDLEEVMGLEIYKDPPKERNFNLPLTFNYSLLEMRASCLVE